MPDRAPASVARLGRVALASVAFFALACGIMQWWRADLDPIAAPLSYYLTGPGGHIVVCAYLVLAVGLAATARAFHLALGETPRFTAATLLFYVAGVGLAATALTEVGKAFGHHEAWQYAHLLAAETTFFSVTIAMLVQAWFLRGDAAWRGRFVFAFVLAALAFAALLFYGFDRSLPRGLAQKGVIVLILAWLGWAAFHLTRTRPMGRVAPHSN